MESDRSTAFSSLASILADLRRVDENLERLAESPLPEEAVLAAEFQGGIDVVRKDLLGDAIDTLCSLSRLDESTAVRRYLESADRLERAGRLVQGDRPELGDPESVAEYLIARHSCLDQEVLGAIYVDVKNRLIADVEIFRGSLDRLSVEPRVILRQALERGASGFLLWHTHPSGDPRPTAADVSFTRRLAASADLLGVRLLDHLILGEPGHWVSLKRSGGWSESRQAENQGEGDE